jgi:hypothetical protein
LNFTITSPGMKVGPLRGPMNLDCARPQVARPRTMLAEVKNLNCMDLTYSATLRNPNILHPKAGTYSVMIPKTYRGTLVLHLTS